MADVSLDEVIRRRGINLKTPIKRPMFGRGAGGTGKGFDARQRIGVNDVRQRLGGGAGFQVKDAREMLGQKDARFKIRGKGGAGGGAGGGAAGGGGGGAGGVKDARQMINSRKEGQIQINVPLQTTTQKTAVTHQLQSQTHVPQMQMHTNHNLSGVNLRHLTRNVQGLNVRGSVTPQPGNNQRVMDARDRLSLKRSIGGTQTQTATAPPLKITKTIQQRPLGMPGGIRAATQPVSNEHDGIANKQMKFMTANSGLPSRPGTLGSTFSMSGPITKVVKNDAYTAPRPPVPVAPTRPNTSTAAAARSSAAALQPVSRTLQQHTAEAATPAPAPPQPAFSPLEGTKITVNNLHPRVTEEDIVELFCVCGALKRARLVKLGVAEVVFVRKEDAVSAYRKYNNRCLDGQPMKCNLHIQGNVITSDQPILLRLSDTPGTGSSTKKDGLPPSLSRPAGQRASSQPTPEVDPQTILKALFKSTAQSSSSSTTEPPSSQATAFRIKI
ncbi:polymerase delta-interacting protein 3 isoform X4 [Labrus mixtus]|uniref:polymerase delta-interacting protein 3 isoform X4 n=1 Tax=Labrus mixtus TaxID=508554 RepID=UPI0029C07405|nr:polymerase delta-interacting protein 3 isoform X4 [Labrus mixtus]